jgi:hypothetical protein
MLMITFTVPLSMVAKAQCSLDVVQIRHTKRLVALLDATSMHLVETFLIILIQESATALHNVTTDHFKGFRSLKPVEM